MTNEGDRSDQMRELDEIHRATKTGRRISGYYALETEVTRRALLKGPEFVSAAQKALRNVREQIDEFNRGGR